MLGGVDGRTWPEMIPFWRAYRPWLAARGFHIFEPGFDNRGYGYTFPPPTQCPVALPYAIYSNVKLDTSMQITPLVSGFDSGKYRSIADYILSQNSRLPVILTCGMSLLSLRRRVQRNTAYMKIYCTVVSYRERISKAYCHPWLSLTASTISRSS